MNACLTSTSYRLHTHTHTHKHKHNNILTTFPMHFRHSTNNLSQSKHLSIIYKGVSFGLRNTKECSMTYRQSKIYNRAKYLKIKNLPLHSLFIQKESTTWRFLLDETDCSGKFLHDIYIYSFQLFQTFCHRTWLYNSSQISYLNLLLFADGIVLHQPCFAGTGRNTIWAQWIKRTKKPPWRCEMLPKQLKCAC